MRHSKNPIHSQVFVKILLKAPLISKVNYDNALFIITKLTTYRSSAFSAAGQEDMRSIVQFLLRDGASGVAVENCLIEQWTLVCRIAALIAVETLLTTLLLNCTADRFPDCQVEF